MRLLLDEQLPAAIADALRASGHDVVAVQERGDLCGLSDAELFEAAQAERRAIVTENVPHFRTLADHCYSHGRSHHGLVYLSNKRLPRHRVDVFIQETVDRLSALLKEDPDDAPTCLEMDAIVSLDVPLDDGDD